MSPTQRVRPILVRCPECQRQELDLFVAITRRATAYVIAPRPPDKDDEDKQLVFYFDTQEEMEDVQVTELVCPACAFRLEGEDAVTWLYEQPLMEKTVTFSEEAPR